MSLEDIFVEEQLMIYLFLLRVNPSLKGYTFIKEAIKQILNEPSKKFSLHKWLYRDISEKYNETEENVDRSIRHAIEVAYKRNGFVEFEKATKIHFSYCKPAPRELLAMLTELVRFNRDKAKCDFDKYVESWDDMDVYI